jgi:CubicO group peptidase (beta-lactamase class C family)
VIGTLIGIAIDEGFIRSLNQPVADFLESVVDDLDDDKHAITIRHLLTMTGGFDWFERGATGYNDWILSPDHINYVLDRPLSDQPGQRFNYNSAAVHLLSVALTEATGMSTLDFAREYLFEPLGIPDVRWDLNNRGYYNGGAGLELRTRDMAKLGALYLQLGFSGKEPVVHSAWVKFATLQHQTLAFSYGALESVNYGYLWWLDHGQAEDVFLAWGYGGQFIYCVPDLQLVVATSAKWRGLGDQVEQQEQGILNLIANHIVPAVR